MCVTRIMRDFISTEKVYFLSNFKRTISNFMINYQKSFNDQFKSMLHLAMSNLIPTIPQKSSMKENYFLVISYFNAYFIFR